MGLLFFGREELPFAESALVPLFDRRPEIAGSALAIVFEPTANRLELGCLGNLNATVVFEGEAAHTARPWLGRNAIHAAIAALAPVTDLPIRDVEVDGLTYREVASVTTIQGGVATNVVPDRATAQVNFRYAPTHTPAEAERRLRELLGHPSATVEIVGNAPPGLVPSGNPLVERLRAAGDLAVGPKQAWTPVAEFGLVGVDAVNFGPGDPQYAHRDDEQRRGRRARQVVPGPAHVPEGAPGNTPDKEKGERWSTCHRVCERRSRIRSRSWIAARRRRSPTGRPIVDFGVGDPREETPAFIRAGRQGRDRTDLLVPPRRGPPRAPRARSPAGSGGASARSSTPTSTSCPHSVRRSRCSASLRRSSTRRVASTW